MRFWKKQTTTISKAELDTLMYGPMSQASAGRAKYFSFFKDDRGTSLYSA
jgi:hypothetical protein